MKFYLRPFVFLLAFSIPTLARTAINASDSLTHPLIDTLIQNIKTKVYPNIHSVLVSHKGQLVMEQYFHGYTADSLHDVHEVIMSITSLLTGIAMDKGFIESLDMPLLRYFPEDSIQEDARKANITLRHLIQMRAGFDSEAFYGIGPDLTAAMSAADNWIKFSLDIPLKDDPGKNFSYNSNQPLLLGAAIAHASDQNIKAFSQEFLFQPLGITAYRWSVTPKGYGNTSGAFFMKPSDMIKIGELVMHSGRWNGRQLISEPWIKTSTRCADAIDFSFTRYAQIHNAKVETAHYGYYWYREHLQYGDFQTDVLFASGSGGQYIMIFEDLDLILVFTGGNYENWKNTLPFKLALKYILPAVKN